MPTVVTIPVVFPPTCPKCKTMLIKDRGRKRLVCPSCGRRYNQRPFFHQKTRK